MQGLACVFRDPVAGRVGSSFTPLFSWMGEKAFEAKEGAFFSATIPLSA